MDEPMSTTQGYAEPATVLIQPNAYSIRLRIGWLAA
jgi:hypothetical protein